MNGIESIAMATEGQKCKSIGDNVAIGNALRD